ncbi:ABC transporter permease [Alkalicoccus urumqiensis]|uniref:ABC transporter permease n=1 Tax=Alkalicoccus urumqiensis TaxID=1548213 RepID=A0A2P6MJX0_ALKUR|nr:ABC transporter permease [Alkalicoccus urumqiensis]PRO66558.1 ABC transporter permease [Alkalicoccus urumqiensis]
MIRVFTLQLKRLRRRPFLVLSFFGLTVVFIMFMGGSQPGGSQQADIAVYPAQGEETGAWPELLGESERFTITELTQAEAEEAIRSGDRTIAVELSESNYRILTGVENELYPLIDSYVRQVFSEELRLREAEASGVGREDLEAALENPVLQTDTSYEAGGEGDFLYDPQLQVLFGMTLFFVMYTILFSLMNTASEKRAGTWDRLIISPLRKWQVYAGHMLYCWLIGVVQILIVFFLFDVAFGYPLAAQAGPLLLITGVYVFAVVAFGMLLIGLVRTPQQLQAAIPISATAMAMLGGAFWPAEIVSNVIVSSLKFAVPVYYAIDALKEMAIQGAGAADVLWNISVLLAFGVLLMGAGINLMERRS